MTLLPHARHDGSNFASMKRPTLAVSAAILGGAIALRTLVGCELDTILRTEFKGN